MGNPQKRTKMEVEIRSRFPRLLWVFLFAISLVWIGNTSSHAQTLPNRIFALAWNPDGTQLALAEIINGQTGIQLRNDTGQEIEFISTPGRVFSVSWSSDGTRLAATYALEGSASYLTSIWQLDTGDILITFEETGAKDDLVAHWNPDINNSLVATLNAGLINIWDAEVGDEVALLVPPSTNCSFLTLTWNRDGTQIFTIGVDGFIRAWDVATGTVIREISLDAPTNLALSPQGNQLAVSDPYGHLTILDPNTFTTQQVLSNEENTTGDPLYAVRWHPDGSQIAAYGFHNISVWDITLGEIVTTIPRPEPWPANPDAFDYNKNGQLTYLGQGNRVIIQPIANAGSDQFVFDNNANNMEAIALDASASYDNDGIIESYQWYENGTLIADGITPQVELAVGEHTITLTIVDDDGATGNDEVVITVEPTTGCIPVAPADPPTYTVAAGDTVGLIAAISAANANADSDIIALEEGTYTLTAADNSWYGDNGLPIIDTPITINGNCSTIERDAAADPFRFFEVHAAGNLTLYDLTLTGGDGDYAYGGAIYSKGTVTATNTTVANSTASNGGGIRNSSGTLTLVDSRLENNSAPGTGHSGGGLYTDGTTILTNTVLTGNSAHYGGAIYINGGTLTLNGSTVEANTAYNGAGAFMYGGSATIQSTSRFATNTVTNSGGAIYNNGTTLTISGSTFENNTAAGIGGAISNSGPLTLSDSQITGNSATSNGGGLYHGGGTATLTNVTLNTNHSNLNGGGLFTATDTTLNACTVSGNTATNNGGGVFVSGGSLALNTSQVTGNTASNGGGGVFSTGSPVTLNASVVSGNSATNGGGGIASQGPLTVTDSSIVSNQAGTLGGGVYNDNASSTGISNSCIAGNTAPQGSGVHSDTENFSAVNNWWGAADGPSGAGSGSGDAVTADVLFTPFLTGGCPH